MGIKVLITGGLGFIGRNLISYIDKNRVSKIIIIDNSKKIDKKYFKKKSDIEIFSNKKQYKKNRKKINIINVDVKDFNFAKEITKGIDFIVHLAAEPGVDLSVSQPYESFTTNVMGGYNYLEAGRINNIKNFIFASSGSVFGNCKPPMKRNYAKCPISPYGSSKLTVESFCSTYSQVFNMNTTVLRFSNAYGKHSVHKQSVISKFIKSYMNNKALTIYGDGKQTRDFVYVKDICSAIYKCFSNTKGYNEYHIGTGKETTLRNLLSYINVIFQSQDIKQPKVIFTKNRIGDMKNNSLYINDTKKILKWSPEYDLKKGLNETINWYLNI
tara:strand:- start:145 stop:1125 length:981 start_codon:yes stop_codon:yes gene_type:complete